LISRQREGGRQGGREGGRAYLLQLLVFVGEHIEESIHKFGEPVEHVDFGDLREGGRERGEEC